MECKSPKLWAQPWRRKGALGNGTLRASVGTDFVTF